jgi:multidrug efflux system outer membrane protein
MRKLAVFLLIFTSCKMGPNYHRPLVEIPESYYFETEDALPTLNLEWWKQFEDEVLLGLIEEALLYNKDVQIAAANIEVAIGLLIQARAPLFPQAGYAGSFNRIRISETLPGFSPAAGLPNPQSTWQALLTGSWDIDVWGLIRRQVEAAEANVEASYEARQGVILSLVASVANGYIQLRGLDEQLAISIKTLHSYGEAVEYFEWQFKYGQVSKVAVAQARTQYEIAAAEIPQFKTSIVETENALSILLGRNPGPIARGKSIYDLTMPAVPEGIPSEILEQRPDIMQAEEQLIAANAQIGVAKARFFPTISLTGNYGNASQKLHQLFEGPSHTWSYTGSIVGPIFTGGALYGQLYQAEAETEAAVINYEKTIQNAFADVENALAAHTNLIEQFDAQEKLVEAAGEYEELATLQYRGGYVPYFTVIQAQEQYFPAQLAWAQTRAALFASLVNIYRALGGGWVDIAEGRTSVSFPEKECIYIPLVSYDMMNLLD